MYSSPSVHNNWKCTGTTHGRSYFIYILTHFPPLEIIFEANPRYNITLCISISKCTSTRTLFY